MRSAAPILFKDCYTGSFLCAKKLKQFIYNVVKLSKIDYGENPYESSDVFDRYVGPVHYGRSDQDKAQVDNNSQFIDINGPAITLKVTGREVFYSNLNTLLYADLTFCIKCTWPTVSDWESRQNRKWPSELDVQNIIKFGAHIVPKSQKDDTD